MSELSPGKSELTRRRGVRLVPELLRPAFGRHRKAAAAGATVMLALAGAAAPAAMAATKAPRSGAAAVVYSRNVCSGWARCAALGYNSYGYGLKANFGKMWWRMFPGYNCTNYVAFVESTVYHIATPSYLLGNGGSWSANAAKHKVLTNNTPSVGAVAVWYGGNHPGLPWPGHIAVVEEVGPGGSWIIISQENISANTNLYEWRYIKKGSTGWQAWPDKFVHFPIPKRGLLGYYDPATQNANFRDSATSGPINTSSPLGTTGTFPLVGNWSSTGTGRTGYFDPGAAAATNALFYLHNVSVAKPEVTVPFGPPNNPKLIPLIGDWNGTGTAGPGYYDPVAGTFYLRQSLTAIGTTAPDFTIQFRPANGTVIPIAGNWTGGKQDSIGYFAPTTGRFTLLATPSSPVGTPYKSFVLVGSPGMIPIAGNWLGGKIDYVGYFNPKTGLFYLRNSLTTGPANTVIHLDGATGMLPLAGDWFGG